MTNISVKETYPIPAEKLWEIIGRVDSMAEWHPGMSSCSVEGTGVGAIRVCDLADGSKLRDRIDEINDAKHYYKYTMLEGPVPVTKLVGLLAAHDNGDGTSTAEWAADFEAADAPPEEIVSRLEIAYGTGLERVKLMLAS